ncbi:MAG: hypothetical protein AAGK97_12280, partial [Bacteroidota bacterium]
MLSACKKDATETIDIDFGYDYFTTPEVGKFIEYKVDSTYFDDSGNFSVSRQVREEVVDVFINEVEDTIYRIERFVRNNENEGWSLSEVISASIQDNQAILTEGNFRFVKMVFPARDNIDFDGTKFIEENVE